MPNDDLLKWVTTDTDLYELLGLTFETFSAAELRRAYRKTALKYHPDKVGKAFDPAKYELFQAANDILSDEELKTKYDNHRNAKLQRQRANALFEGKRRQMKEDLEARERSGGASVGMKRRNEEDSMGLELRRLAEEGRKRRAARQSMMAMSSPRSPAPATAPRSASIPPEVASQDDEGQFKPQPQPQPPPPTDQAPDPDAAEDEIERLERKIREVTAAKAHRKAAKKARKSGVFNPSTDSPHTTPDPRAQTPRSERFTGAGATPTTIPLNHKQHAGPRSSAGVPVDTTSSASASPRFSFSPSAASTSTNTPTAMSSSKSEFARTMERLRAAERERRGMEEGEVVVRAGEEG